MQQYATICNSLVSKRWASGANSMQPALLSRDLGPHDAIGTCAAHGINATEQPRPAQEVNKNKYYT